MVALLRNSDCLGKIRRLNCDWLRPILERQSILDLVNKTGFSKLDSLNQESNQNLKKHKSISENLCSNHEFMVGLLKIFFVFGQIMFADAPKPGLH